MSKRITSIIMSFLFLTLTLGTSPMVAGASTYAPTTGTSSVPVVSFTQKPLAEYISGSNVSFKVISKTSVSTAKIEYSVKLFNLDTQKKELDVINYGKAVLGSQIQSYSFAVKNPGNYRLAVYVRAFGTKGLVNSYYDNYVTNDFKVVKLDKVTKALVGVDPINAIAYLKNTYTLPTTVGGKMSDGTIKQYKVTWDKVANTNTLGTYTFKGTIKDLTTSAVIKNFTAKLTLKVCALPVFSPISVTVDAFSQYVLPITVDGKNSDGTIKKFGATWDKTANTTTSGAFTFTGVVRDLDASVNLKNVTVKLVLKVNAPPVFNSTVVTVDEGASYTLPTTVSGKLSDGSTKEFGVTWDKTASTTTPGAYTFTGAVKDMKTSVALKNVTAILTLNVKAIPKIDPIEVNVTEGTQYTLPTTVSARMSDGTVKVYNVAWDKAPDTSKVGTYTFNGDVKDPSTSIVLQNVKATLKLNVNAVPLQANAVAYNSKTLKITFNKTVESSKCNINVSRDSIFVPLTLAWGSDGKSVVLQSPSDLPIGTYIIKVNGIGLATDTYSVTVKTIELSSISIPTVYITPNNAAAKILVNGKDQYGQSIDIATSDFEWTVSDETARILLQVTTTGDNYLTVQTNLTGIKAGDKVTVTGRYRANIGVFTTASLEVNTKSIDSFTLGQPVLPDTDKRLTIKQASTYYEVPYEAIQNYTVNGTVTRASAVLDDRAETSLVQDVTLNNITFVTDKPDILTNIKVQNGKLYVQIGANKSGTAKLMAIVINSNGQTTAPFTLLFDISGPAIPNDITIGNSAAILTTGGPINKLPIQVYDQYGEALSADAFAKTNFTDFIVTSSNSGVATAVFSSDGKTLNITPVALGTTDIKVTNRNSGKIKIYTVVVNAASTVKDFTTSLDYTAIQRGAAAILKIQTLDQYGNKLASAPATYKYAIVANSGGANVRVSATNLQVLTAGTSIVALIGITAGKVETITVTLYNDANSNNSVDSTEIIKAYAFNINVVADTEQLMYSVNPIDTAYAAVAQDRNNTGLNNDAYGTIQNQNNKNVNYAQKITLRATRIDGTPVALAGNPITSIAATLNQSVIDFAGKIGSDFFIIGKQWSGSELTKDANIQVNYIDNAGVSKNLVTKVTVSKESLKATKIKFMTNSLQDNDVTNDIELEGSVITLTPTDFNGLNGKKLIENQNLTGYPCYFEVDDQYGVSSINPVSFTMVSKQSAAGVFAIDDLGYVTASGFVSGEGATISATDTEGHILTITIKVQ